MAKIGVNDKMINSNETFWTVFKQCVGKEESLILEVNVKLGFKYMDPLFQNSSRYFSKGVIST